MVHHHICPYFVYSGLLWYLGLHAHKPVIIYLGGSCLHLNQDILIWAAEMLLDVANRGDIQNVRSVATPESVHLETNCMWLLHKGTIGPIP